MSNNEISADVIALTVVSDVLALASFLNVKIAGMQAENQLCASLGKLPAHLQSDFEVVANQYIRRIDELQEKAASFVRNQGRK